MKMKRFLILMTLVCAFFALAGSASAAGKKYGLFVGINKYTGGINELAGCVNDVTNVRATLMQKFGFLQANTTMLTDAAATREAIIANLLAYQAKAQKGDLFVFDYSGHGTLFPDARSEDQDETNLTYLEVMNEDTGKMEVWYPRAKYDSAIVPVDARSTTSGKPWRNLILDDELAAIFAGFTKKGAQVVFISDSCHSGTIGRAKKSSDPVRTTSLATVFGTRRYEDLQLDQPATTRTSGFPVPINPLYIVLTGSKDDEFSLDARGYAQPMGMFTYWLLNQINSAGGSRLTYQATMTAVSKKVAEEAGKEDNNQHPQLDSRYGNPSAVLFSLPR
jgi:hypothetical protein